MVEIEKSRNYYQHGRTSNVSKNAQNGIRSSTTIGQDQEAPELLLTWE